MSESTQTTSQPRRRHREPLRVTLAGDGPSRSPERLPEAPKWGPRDLRLEMILKLSGPDTVVAEERVCTDLPGALTPPGRGALFRAIDQALAGAGHSVKLQAGEAIRKLDPSPGGSRPLDEPDPLNSTTASWQGPDEFPPQNLPPAESDSSARMTSDIDQIMQRWAELPPPDPTDYPDVLPLPPKKSG